MNSTPSIASGAPPCVQWMAAIHASSRKNVRWMRTAVPPTSNSLIDQPMGQLRSSVCPSAAAMQSRFPAAHNGRAAAVAAYLEGRTRAAPGQVARDTRAYCGG